MTKRSPSQVLPCSYVVPRLAAQLSQSVAQNPWISETLCTYSSGSSSNAVQLVRQQQQLKSVWCGCSDSKQEAFHAFEPGKLLTGQAVASTHGTENLET